MKSNENVIQANLPIDMIDANPDNEKVFSMDDLTLLTEAIIRNGFRGSIEVYQKADGRYEIIAGHRRTEAAKLAGLEYIPAMIYPMPDDEIQKRELMVDSNIYSRDFSYFDWANAINYHKETLMLQQAQAKKKGLPLISVKDELAKHFGMTSAMIYNYLSILDMIPEVKKLYANRQLPIAIASQLSSLDEELQRKAYDEFYKLLSLQGSDDDGKKRITTTQASHIITKVKADYEREKHRREPAIRVGDQFYSSVNTTPSFDYSQAKTDDVKKESPIKKQSNFFNQLISNSPFDKQTTAPTVKESSAEVDFKKETPLVESKKPEEYILPIDRAINQVAIQLQRLTNSSIKVEKKEDVRVSIDMVKRAIEAIEKEL